MLDWLTPDVATHLLGLSLMLILAFFSYQMGWQNGYTDGNNDGMQGADRRIKEETRDQ